MSELRLLIVACGGRRFALPVERVREVLDRGDVTPVPLLPASLAGVVSVRGEVLPAIDLCTALSLTPEASTQRLVLVHSDAGTIALRVDDAPGIASGRLLNRMPRALQQSLENPLLRRAVRIADRDDLPLLDLDRLLSVLRPAS